MYEEIIKKFAPEKENLIYILHEIQDNHPQNFVPEEAIIEVSEYLKLSPAHIHGVLTFYPCIALLPVVKM